MNRIHHIRRLIRILAGLVASLVAVGVAAPAAFARVEPQLGPASPGEPATAVPPQNPAPVPAHVVAVGMPGWQIALIAVGAAILAAILAVLVDRARSARRAPATTAA